MVTSGKETDIEGEESVVTKWLSMCFVQFELKGRSFTHKILT